MTVGKETLRVSGAMTEVARPQETDHLNNFDALRLFAALLVMYSHQFFFLGRAQPAPTGSTLGEVAVMIFFIISGYLVTESWYRDPHLVRFAMRRLLRLWPALAAATIVIALTGALLTTLPVREYFGRATGHFVVRNLLLRMVYQLPSVFVTHPGNPAMSAVNGSWWSIHLEAKCYLYLALLGLIGLRRRWFSVLALGAFAVIYFKTLPGHPRADAHQNLLSFYTVFFLTGACARQFRTELLRFRIPLLVAGIATVIVAITTGQYPLAEWAVLVPLTLRAGSLSTPGLRSAGRFGDLSYGIYLYAYFVQQLTVRLWPGKPFFAGPFLVAVAITSLIAWCSWHAVEARALQLKRHLRRWFPDNAA